MHAAGREDIDVRMLGSGRPFYIQLTNARVFPDQESLDRVLDEINKSHDQVQCQGLRPITRDETEIVKEGQEQKHKEYRCIIRVSTEWYSLFIVLAF